MTWLRAAAFLIAAPGTVCVLIPWLLSRWFPASLPHGGWRYAGLIAMGSGAVGLLWCFCDFVIRGKGTPSPLDPPKRLVVSGLYRWTRNPMYVAIVFLLVGEAVFFARGILLAWAAFMWLAFQLSVRYYEEPRLRLQFGDEFDEYCDRVRRWI